MHRIELDHIGIVSNNFDNSCFFFKELGYCIKSGIIEDNVQNNYIQLLCKNDSKVNIELVLPMNSKSTVYNCKLGFHHICYRIIVEEEKEIDEFIREFNKWHIGRMITTKINAPAFQNKDVQFACVAGGIMVEFIYVIRNGD